MISIGNISEHKNIHVDPQESFNNRTASEENSNTEDGMNNDPGNIEVHRNTRYPKRKRHQPPEWYIVSSPNRTKLIFL